MGKDKCCCGSDACCEPEEDELVFLYCPKCHKRLTVAEEGRKEKLEVECCGMNMVNLSEVPTMVGNVFECAKCGAKICVEEDCDCLMFGKECVFECCGEKMRPAGNIYDGDCCCGEKGCDCGCDGDKCDCGDEKDGAAGDEVCDCGCGGKKDDCGCGDGECECDECEDNGEYLVCPECRGIVSVIEPCTCGDDCGVKCCGVKMINMKDIPDNAGKYFKCDCGVEFFIDCDSDVASPDKYAPVLCDGKPIQPTGLTEDDKDPAEFMEDAPAYFCTECERLVFVSDNKEGRKVELSCCGRKMIDVTSLEKIDGEIYECGKCGLKLIVENDCLCRESGRECVNKCCGEPMRICK